MTTQLEKDLSKISALYEHQQGEARRAIQVFQLEVEKRKEILADCQRTREQNRKIYEHKNS